MKNLFWTKADPAAGAVTAQKSTQQTNATANPPTKNMGCDEGGRKRVLNFSHTQVGAGDATSTVDLVTLPTGKIRVLKRDCHVVCSAFGAARTLDIGNLAYIKADGSAGAAAADVILDGADVSALANLQGGVGTNALTAAPVLTFDNKGGVVLQAVVAGGTIPDGATLAGTITYTTDN